MPGPAPKQTRRRRNAPARGEWQASPGIGWQHGPIPEPPDGLIAVSRDAWQTWFKSWVASHWTPSDLPGLGILVSQFDAVKRSPGSANELTALVRLMDNYGITPAGAQARRWSPPKSEEPPVDSRNSEAAPTGDPYRHLRAVV